MILIHVANGPHGTYKFDNTEIVEFKTFLDDETLFVHQRWMNEPDFWFPIQMFNMRHVVSVYDDSWQTYTRELTEPQNQLTP